MTPLLIALVATLAALALGYWFLIRPWHLRWGATDEEVARAMPLDDQVKRPTYVTNRALTLKATPEEIWPWLAQMGELPRGGFYSYVLVERLLGLRVENSERILPEFQQLSVGQALDRVGDMLVKAVEPNRYLVLGPPEETIPQTNIFDTTWAIALYPIDDKSTRLISRVRIFIKITLRGLFWLTLLDFGQFVMERKMLTELKRRAERIGKEVPAAAKRMIGSKIEAL